MLLFKAKLKYFSKPFGITLTLQLNLPNSPKIKWLSYPLKLRNITGTFLLIFKLILLDQCAAPLYLPVI